MRFVMFGLWWRSFLCILRFLSDFYVIFWFSDWCSYLFMISSNFIPFHVVLRQISAGKTSRHGREVFPAASRAAWEPKH